MAATLLNPTIDTAERFARPVCLGASTHIGMLGNGNALARRHVRQ